MKKLKVKSIKWLQDFDNTRKDSVWYGGEIVEIMIGRYRVTIGAFGDIGAEINGEWYSDCSESGRFAEYLEEQGIHNDEELKKAKANIIWENNNWFEAGIWDTKEKDWIGNSCDMIIDELDANDDFAWLSDWINKLLD